MEPFETAPQKIVVHHSASNAGLHTWQEIRQWHLAKGWDDIGYHYGITNSEPQSGEEARLEKEVTDFFFKYSPFNPSDLYPTKYSIKIGRSPRYMGAHAKGFNHDTLGVCFEGDFNVTKMDMGQLLLGAALCSYILQDFNIDTAYIDHNLTCHRDLPYPTLCPGRFFPLHTLWGLVNDCLSLYLISDHNPIVVES